MIRTRHFASIAMIVVILVLGGIHPLTAEPTAEVKELRAIVEELRKRIEKQDQKIASLEQALKALAGSELQRTSKVSPSVKPTESLDGWKNPANWKRLKRGMSESQVREILGPPTSTNFSTWYYEGHVSGSGNVSGNVWWLERRLTGISEPVFYTNR